MKHGSEWTYSDVRSTLDNEAVGKTVKANGATLLIQIDLLFRKEMGNSAACTKTNNKNRKVLKENQIIIKHHVTSSGRTLLTTQ